MFYLLLLKNNFNLKEYVGLKITYVIEMIIFYSIINIVIIVNIIVMRIFYVFLVLGNIWVF